MKKIILCTILIAFTTVSFAQQTTSTQHWTETDYYKKSKKQKTAAWIFTGTGTAILLVTLVTDAFTSAFSGFQESASGIAIPYAIGGASVATGIVLFVASGNNKKKAKATSAFLQLEKAPVMQGAIFNNQSFPVVGVKIRL